MLVVLFYYKVTTARYDVTKTERIERKTGGDEREKEPSRSVRKKFLWVLLWGLLWGLLGMISLGIVSLRTVWEIVSEIEMEIVSVIVMEIA